VGPIHPLHYQEGPTTPLPKVVNPDDVGVVQPGGRLGLPDEPLPQHPVLGQGLPENLHRHRPVEQFVVGQVDLGHAALADPAFQPVPARDDRRGPLPHTVC